MFLEINQIRKSYGSGESRVEVLKGIDLYVEQGEFCVLLGPSGSGKSTLLNIIGGIDQADSGDICIRGERMADMKEKKESLISQYRKLNPEEQKYIRGICWKVVISFVVALAVAIWLDFFSGETRFLIFLSVFVGSLIGLSLNWAGKIRSR